MRDVPDEVLDRARELRAQGLSWNKVGLAVELPTDTIRWRIDPEFAVKWRERHTGPKTWIHARKAYEPSKVEVHKALQSIQADTRTRLQRWMGDPPAGRSALDQRKQHVS